MSKVIQFPGPDALSPDLMDLFSLTEEGRAFLEYHSYFHSKPFSYSSKMPDQARETVERLGGITGLYRECIRQGVTWETLTGWEGLSDTW